MNTATRFASASCLKANFPTIDAHRSGRPLANRLSLTQLFVLSLLVAVPAVIVVLPGYSAARGGKPSDNDLTARFLLHQADFEALPQMLDSDRGRLPLVDGPFDLADLIAAGVARSHDYRGLLTRIGAADIRYFPRSGNIVLSLAGPHEHFFTDTRMSYMYLSREQPQPLPDHPGYARPGIYFVTEDHRIKGKWFIHHDRTVAVAFAAY